VQGKLTGDDKTEHRGDHHCENVVYLSIESVELNHNTTQWWPADCSQIMTLRNDCSQCHSSCCRWRCTWRQHVTSFRPM